MAVYLVESQGLQIRFPTSLLNVYSYGKEGEYWPSIGMNPDFRKEKQKIQEYGWDIEGPDTDGVWRRWKQELDGGKLTTILGGEN